MLGYTFKGSPQGIKTFKVENIKEKIKTFDVVCYVSFQRARILVTITNNENYWQRPLYIYIPTYYCNRNLMVNVKYPLALLMNNWQHRIAEDSRTRIEDVKSYFFAFPQSILHLTKNSIKHLFNQLSKYIGGLEIPFPFHSWSVVRNILVPKPGIRAHEPVDSRGHHVKNPHVDLPL